MPNLDRPPLSVATILGTADRHGLILQRGDWKFRTRICASTAYAIAYDPRLAARPWLDYLDIVATDVPLYAVEGLVDGFEGFVRQWSYWIVSASYRRAYRVGREVWREVQRRSQVLPVPPMANEDGPPDDGSAEMALAGVGTDDFEPDDHWRSSSGG